MTKPTTPLLPHVEFLIPTPVQEARVIAWFCGPRPVGWDWSHKVFARHPELEDMLRDVTEKALRAKIFHTYAKRYHRAHAGAFEHARLTQEKEWKKIEELFLKTLSAHFETEYPPRRKVMRAYVSMVPIYPRWIDTWSFNVSYFNPARVKSIACHEILHFLYFKKWAEVFPDTPREHFNAPHLIWRLSEILDPIILNEHPTLRELVGTSQSTYAEFDRMRIANVRPFTYFTRLYRRHLKSGKPFADFLREAWEEAKKYEGVLVGK